MLKILLLFRSKLRNITIPIVTPEKFPNYTIVSRTELFSQVFFFPKWKIDKK